MLKESRSFKHSLRSFILNDLNGKYHATAIVLYLVLVILHFSEHVAQLYQYLVLGWSARDSGGFLGFYLPNLAESEVLHSAYNSFQLTGLILLVFGFKRRTIARRWWLTALVFQSWHWLEHALLQVQFLTGVYLFNAIKQRSVLEFFFPRIELHFTYNLLVFVPTFVALWFYFFRLRKA